MSGCGIAGPLISRLTVRKKRAECGVGEREEELESRRMCLFISWLLEDPARATDAAKLPPVDLTQISLWPTLMYRPTGDMEFQLIKMDSYKTTAGIYIVSTWGIC